MQLRRHSGTPLYRQVEQELRRRVENGDLTPGDRLPTEAVLATELAVNRLTVRQALGELARAGTVQTRQGIGTFVAERGPAAEFTIRPEQHEVRADSAIWAVPTGTEQVCETVLHAALDDCADARGELGLPAGTALRRVDTLVSHDEQPWIVSSYWLADARFPDLADAITVHGTPIGALLHRYGMVLRYSWRSFAAGLATPDDSLLLDIPPGSPLLLREGLNCDDDATPTVYVRRRCRSDRIRFVLRYDPADSGKSGDGSRPVV